jgi:hypothetical protein
MDAQVISACLGECMFYVLNFAFHLIRIQNLYQIVGLDETYKFEFMKIFRSFSRWKKYFPLKSK